MLLNNKIQQICDSSEDNLSQEDLLEATPSDSSDVDDCTVVKPSNYNVSSFSEVSVSDADIDVSDSEYDNVVSVSESLKDFGIETGQHMPV